MPFKDFIEGLMISKETNETILLKAADGTVKRLHYTSPGFDFPSMKKAKGGWATFLKYLHKTQPFSPNENERKALHRLSKKLRVSISEAFR